MKKLALTVILISSIFVLSGCVVTDLLFGSTKTLTCTMEESDDEYESTTTFEIVAKNNVYQTGSYTMEMTYSEDYTDWMTFFEAAMEETMTEYEEYDGIDYSYDIDGTTLTMNIDIDYIEYAKNTDADLDDFDFESLDAYETIDDMMEEYEDLGYTCTLK